MPRIKPGDADRLARLGDEAGDAFAEPHFRAGAVLGVSARRDRDEDAGLFGGHQDRRVLEPEALVEPAQDRVDQRLERVGAIDVRRRDPAAPWS